MTTGREAGSNSRRGRALPREIPGLLARLGALRPSALARHRKSPSGVVACAARVLRSVSEGVSAWRRADQHDAPLAQRHVLPARRREGEEGPIAPSELGEPDSMAVQPRRPPCARPLRIDLPWGREQAVADEELPYPRNKSTAPVARSAAPNRVADVEELLVGRGDRTSRIREDVGQRTSPSASSDRRDGTRLRGASRLVSWWRRRYGRPHDPGSTL
jgi:hypothetical protein